MHDYAVAPGCTAMCLLGMIHNAQRTLLASSTEPSGATPQLIIMTRLQADLRLIWSNPALQFVSEQAT